MTRGRFITLEGGEGVGKSTNLAFVCGLLERHGHEVHLTREPGGTPLAEEIREALLREREESVDALAETLLMFAARAQHMAEVIEPSLAAGRWVLCDRFTDSTFAYQAGGRRLDEGIVTRLASLVHAARWPDLTLYLDAPVDVARARIAARGMDRFEAEQKDFFERVRAVYRQRAREHGRIVEIDASRSLHLVHADLSAVVGRFLAANADGGAPR